MRDSAERVNDFLFEELGLNLDEAEGVLEECLSNLRVNLACELIRAG